MDKRGIYIPEEGQPLAELFQAIANEQGEPNLSEQMDECTAESEEQPPQKVSMADWLKCPERQRRAKIAHEASQRAAYQRQMAEKQQREENPIRARPRKKRGRKRR